MYVCHICIYIVCVLYTVISKPTHQLSIFQFKNTRARDTLQTWANNLIQTDGTVSHSEAVLREQLVVDKISKGEWPEEVYHEYQLFAASYGNVDSARLMLEYGIGYRLQEETSHGVSVNEVVSSAFSCSIPQLHHALDSGKSPNVPLSDGTTALMAASYSGCTEAVDVLLQTDAEVDAIGRHGATAFMIASAMGHTDIVRKLSAGGADVTIKHRFANTSPLHMASEMEQVEAIKLLCELGYNGRHVTALGGNALHTAAQVGAANSVLALVSSPCSVPVDGLMNGDTTPLYLASQHGHSNTVKALLQCGANVSFSMPVSPYKGSRELSTSKSDSATNFAFVPNSEAGNGASALHAAAENGHSNIVRLLIEQGGADVDMMGGIGVTALHLAAQYDRKPVAKELLSMGAAVDVHATTDGSTALYYAVGYGSLGMVRILLRAGASPLRQRAIPNIKGQDRHESAGGIPVRGTPLMYAVLLGRYEIMQSILNYERKIGSSEAVVNYVDTDGTTLVHAAAGMTGPSRQDDVYDDILSLLISFGCDSRRIQSSSGKTALHFAALGGSTRAVKLLLRSVDDATLQTWVNIKDDAGYTALHYAVSTVVAGDVEENSAAVECISEIIRAGGNVDARVEQIGGLQGATALYLAASGVNAHFTTVAVRALLKAGADPDVTLEDSAKGFTPLLAAIDRSNSAVVEALLFDGHADPNKGVAQSTSLTQSPILFAVVKGSTPVVDFLLQSGATCDIRIMHPSSDNPLSLIGLARIRRDYDMLQLLMASSNCTEDVEV